MKFAKDNNDENYFCIKKQKKSKALDNFLELDFYRNHIDLQYENLFFSYNEKPWASP